MAENQREGCAMKRYWLTVLGGMIVFGLAFWQCWFCRPVAAWRFRLTNLSEMRIPAIGTYVDPVTVTQDYIEAFKKMNKSVCNEINSKAVQFEIVCREPPVVQVIVRGEDSYQALAVAKRCETNFVEFIKNCNDATREKIKSMNPLIGDDDIERKLNTVEIIEHAHLERRMF